MIITFLYQNSPPPPLATQPMLSMITTFLLSKFDPPPWQPMLSMIQVQVLHSFYQEFDIHFFKISPRPLATQPMLSMITTFLLSKFDPPPLATHAFNDSGSSTTFLLSRFLHFFYQHFPFPLGNPTHAFNDYYIPFIKNSPPCQPNPCFQ